MLSWFTAKALQEADTNNNNELSYTELSSYLNMNILFSSNQFMQPEFSPQTQSTEAIFQLSERVKTNINQWPNDIFLKLREKSPLQSYFSITKGKSTYKISNTKIGSSIYSITENIRYETVFQIIVTITPNSLKTECTVNTSLSNPQKFRYQKKFMTTPPKGKQILITIAVLNTTKALQNLLGDSHCKLTKNDLIIKIPSLLEKTSYQLGVAELFVW